MEDGVTPAALPFSVQQVVGSPVLCMETREQINRSLEVGERLVVQSLLHTVVATVESVTGLTATARSGRLACFLIWEDAPRHCWVCTCTGDLDAIQKVKFV